MLKANCREKENTMLICNTYLRSFTFRNEVPKRMPSGTNIGVNWPIHQL